MIPWADPRAGYLAHRAEIDAAIAAVLDGGRYILGENVAALEAELAAHVGVRHGIGVASGTDALEIALRACGIGPGDEVITVGHTAVATVAAIEACGAAAALVDIEPDGYTLAADLLGEAIGERTKAVIPVHLYGQPAALEGILAVARSRGLRVIEDCAQAHGASIGDRRVGSFGDAGAFSFYPTKNLGAIGDGGMIVTNDAAVADRARLLRAYGWRERYISEIAGGNSRLDELQAAILRVKLRHLEADNGSRRRLAARYRELLSGSAVVPPPQRPGTSHAYHLFVVRSRERDRLATELSARGIATGIHYPVPVHLQPAYRGRLRGSERLPRTEAAAREVLSLPLYPELPEGSVERVAQAVREIAPA